MRRHCNATEIAHRGTAFGFCADGEGDATNCRGFAYNDVIASRLRNTRQWMLEIRNSRLWKKVQRKNRTKRSVKAHQRVEKLDENTLPAVLLSLSTSSFLPLHNVQKKCGIHGRATVPTRWLATCNGLHMNGQFSLFYTFFRFFFYHLHIGCCVMCLVDGRLR